MTSTAKILLKIFENTSLLLSLITINLISAVIGFYYYSSQLSASAIYVWPFIPDCPLYTLLLAIILIAYVRAKETPDVLKFITSVGLAKYGTWTVLVIAGFSSFYFSIDQNVYITIALMHVGMAVEFIVPLALVKKVKASYIAFALVWFFLNDIFDYYVGTHPPIPDWGVEVIAVLTFVMTPVFIGLVYASSRFLNNVDITTSGAGVAKLGQRRRA